jgi:flagellar hook assembly protein FlgD
LYQSYTNPINAVTVIEYDLPKAVMVEVCIYNILGQRVRVLVDEYQRAENKTVKWDGKDDQG